MKRGSTTSHSKRLLPWIGLAAGLAGLAMGVAAYRLFVGGEDAWGRVQRTGVIRIGYAVEAPYAFLTPEGDVTGESPEVAKRIVARLGVPKIVWRQMAFDRLIPELEAGHIDMIAAGMFITPDRSQRVLFSEPTFRVCQGLLVPKGNPLGLHSCGEVISNDRVRIAVLSGSVEEVKLRELSIPERRLMIVPDALTGQMSIETGAADALALSAPSVRWMALKNRLGSTEAVQAFDPNPKAIVGWGAFGFQRNAKRLLRVWNGAQRSFVGSAEHRTLLSQFGFLEEEVSNLSSEVLK